MAKKIKSDIECGNHLPGTERYTKPEEVKALNKYLSKNINVHENSLDLGKETDILPSFGRSMSQPHLVDIDSLNADPISIKFNDGIDKLPQISYKLDDPDVKLDMTKLGLEVEDVELRSEIYDIEDKDVVLSDTKLNLETQDFESSDKVYKLDERGVDFNDKVYELPEKEIDLSNTLYNLEDKDTALSDTKLSLETQDFKVKNKVYNLDEKEVDFNDRVYEISEKSVDLKNTIYNVEEKDITLSDTKPSLETQEIEVKDKVYNLDEKEVGLESELYSIEDKEITLSNKQFEITEVETVLPEKTYDLEESSVNLSDTIYTLSENPINLSNEISLLENGTEEISLSSDVENITDLNETSLSDEILNLNFQEDITLSDAVDEIIGSEVLSLDSYYDTLSETSEVDSLSEVVAPISDSREVSNLYSQVDVLNHGGDIHKLSDEVYQINPIDQNSISSNKIELANNSNLDSLPGFDRKNELTTENTDDLSLSKKPVMGPTENLPELDRSISSVLDSGKDFEELSSDIATNPVEDKVDSVSSEIKSLSDTRKIKLSNDPVLIKSIDEVELSDSIHNLVDEGVPSVSENIVTLEDHRETILSQQVKDLEDSSFVNELSETIDPLYIDGVQQKLSDHAEDLEDNKIPSSLSDQIDKLKGNKTLSDLSDKLVNLSDNAEVDSLGDTNSLSQLLNSSNKDTVVDDRFNDETLDWLNLSKDQRSTFLIIADELKNYGDFGDQVLTTLMTILSKRGQYIKPSDTSMFWSLFNYKNRENEIARLRSQGTKDDLESPPKESLEIYGKNSIVKDSNISMISEGDYINKERADSSVRGETTSGVSKEHNVSEITSKEGFKDFITKDEQLLSISDEDPKKPKDQSELKDKTRIGNYSYNSSGVIKNIEEFNWTNGELKVVDDQGKTVFDVNKDSFEDYNERSVVIPNGFSNKDNDESTGYEVNNRVDSLVKGETTSGVSREHNISEITSKEEFKDFIIKDKQSLSGVKNESGNSKIENRKESQIIGETTSGVNRDRNISEITSKEGFKDFITKDEQLLSISDEDPKKPKDLASLKNKNRLGNYSTNTAGVVKNIDDLIWSSSGEFTLTDAKNIKKETKLEAYAKKSKVIPNGFSNKDNDESTGYEVDNRVDSLVKGETTSGVSKEHNVSEITSKEGFKDFITKDEQLLSISDEDPKKPKTLSELKDKTRIGNYSYNSSGVIKNIEKFNWTNGELKVVDDQGKTVFDVNKDSFEDYNERSVVIPNGFSNKDNDESTGYEVNNRVDSLVKGETTPGVNKDHNISKITSATEFHNHTVKDYDSSSNNHWRVPDYKLPDLGPSLRGAASPNSSYSSISYWFNKSFNAASYVRWAVEEIVEKIKLDPGLGSTKQKFLDETLGVLIEARNQLEYYAKSSPYRLPGGDYGLLSNLASGSGVSGSKVATNLVSSVTTSMMSKAGKAREYKNKPYNRPTVKNNNLGASLMGTGGGEELKPKTSWVAFGQRVEDSPSATKNSSNFNFGKTLVSSLVGSLGNKSEDEDKATYEEIRQFSDYTNIPKMNSFGDVNPMGFGVTATELLPINNDDEREKLMSFEGLQDLLKRSPRITTPDKFTSTELTRTYTTLDSNHIWEILIEPYVGVLNQNRTFLPYLAQIDLDNKVAFNITTAYNKGWLPISGYEFQDKKLVSRDLGLFNGNISFPVGMEFMNELRITFVDDSLKSLRRYFDLCAKVSAYMSYPNIADDKSKSAVFLNPVVYLEGKINPGLYKNLSFLVSIYVMTPQLAVIKKCKLLCVMREYSIENQGEVDASPTDLAVTFSIVGENPPDALKSPSLNLDSFVFNPPKENKIKWTDNLLSNSSGLISLF